MGYTAGLDWGSTEHALCVIDGAGQVVLRSKIVHSAEGLAELLRQLTRLAPAEELPMAIERPSGDHARVAEWRRVEAERLTRERRPDLWAAYQTRKDAKKAP